MIVTLRSNTSLRRTGIDKVLGRGRGGVAPEQVWGARVLSRLAPAAEIGR